MMRRLKAGEFDDKAFSFKAQLIENYEIPTLAPEADPIAELFSSVSSGSASKGDVSLLFELPKQPAKNDPAPQPQKPESSKTNGKAINIDEAILSFFGPREK
jgi:hypothetical protein